MIMASAVLKLNSTVPTNSIRLALYPEHRSISAMACISCIFGMRAAVIHWGLTVPHWLITKPMP